MNLSLFLDRRPDLSLAVADLGHSELRKFESYPSSPSRMFPARIDLGRYISWRGERRRRSNRMTKIFCSPREKVFSNVRSVASK